MGTARKLVILMEQDGEFYKGSNPNPLSKEDVEKHQGEEDKYEQHQAAICEVIYRTVDKSTFLQVKNETDAAAVQNKVISTHANKGSMYETNLLTQLQTLQLTENGDM